MWRRFSQFKLDSRDGVRRFRMHGAVTAVALIAVLLPLNLPVAIGHDSADTLPHPSFAPEGRYQAIDPADRRAPDVVSTAPAADDFPEPFIEATAPELTSSSAFAVDLTTGDVLYQEQPDERSAPASTVKIITALVAMEVLDPDEEVVIRAGDLVDTTVYSNAELQEGDVVTVEHLLAGALIPSGGDAAKALAREAGTRLGANGDPVERFVEEMNSLAHDLGMRNSSFVNPDGADDPDQYTSARDLAIAGKALVEHPLLVELVAQLQFEMTITGPNARSYEVYTTNEMLGFDRVLGIKTGTTGVAGECLVMLTTRGGNRILTVVMGSEDRYEDTQALLDYIDEQVTWVEFDANGEFPSVQSAAERFNFILATPMVRPVLNGEAEQLYTRVTLGPRPESLVPIAWGYVVFLHDGEELYRVPVVTIS